MKRWGIRWKRQWANPTQCRGTWWRAYSLEHTVESLLRDVKKEEVAVLILEHLQGVRTRGEFENGMRIIELQLTLPTDRHERYGLDLCLSEIGVGLIDVIQSTKETEQ